LGNRRDVVLPMGGVNVPLGFLLLLRCYVLHRLLRFPSEIGRTLGRGACYEAPILPICVTFCNTVLHGAAWGRLPGCDEQSP
jgi:hypothetical protein